MAFFLFFYIRELPSSGRGMNDPVCDPASEEIYQDLCMLLAPIEVVNIFICCIKIFIIFYIIIITVCSL